MAAGYFASCMREKSGGGLLVHPPGFVAVAGACFKGGAEE
jgi:hypothetical protein